MDQNVIPFPCNKLKKKYEDVYSYLGMLNSYSTVLSVKDVLRGREEISNQYRKRVWD